jgi:hypothetical protein
MADCGVYLCTQRSQNGIVQLRVSDVITDCTLVNMMLRIPLSMNVFVSGSFATWLCERLLTKAVPEWVPNDIDVFVSLPSTEFEDLVGRFEQLHSSSCSRAVSQKTDMINVLMDGIIISFIRVAAASSYSDVVSEFDIDVCSPIVLLDDDVVWVQMSQHVESGIRHRLMHCTVRKRSSRFLQYPFQRILHRLSKYQARGYTLQSLTFVSGCQNDMRDGSVADGRCVLSVDDFNLLVPQRRGLPHDHFAVFHSEVPSNEEASCQDRGHHSTAATGAGTQRATAAVADGRNLKRPMSVEQNYDYGVDCDRFLEPDGFE